MFPLVGMAVAVVSLEIFRSVGISYEAFPSKEVPGAIITAESFKSTSWECDFKLSILDLQVVNQDIKLHCKNESVLHTEEKTLPYGI